MLSKVKSVIFLIVYAHWIRVYKGWGCQVSLTLMTRSWIAKSGS